MVMKINLIWKGGLFSNSYSIYSKGELIGKVKNRTFSQTAIGELDSKEYQFKTKGFLNQHTEIIDNLEKKVIGEISYKSWMTKATISVNSKTISWKYTNIWSTKWSLFDSEGINIKYSGSSAKGQIDSNVDDALLILSGLVVTNYYWQMSIGLLVAVFVPIWKIVLN
jgi:hypothetical protein